MPSHFQQMPMFAICGWCGAMIGLSGEAYLWLKALHLISVIAWLAGMLYLPRLFVYHCDAAPGSELSETLKVMERRLLNVIINPAMIASWAFGLAMLASGGEALWSRPWMIVKLVCVVALLVAHSRMVKWCKDFGADRNTRSQKFYRIANEVPTALMIMIIIMVVVQPF